MDRKFSVEKDASYDNDGQPVTRKACIDSADSGGQPVRADEPPLGSRRGKLARRLSGERQMSEAMIVSAFLAFSGGFQDAYTYICADRQHCPDEHALSRTGVGRRHSLSVSCFIVRGWRPLRRAAREPSEKCFSRSLAAGDCFAGDLDSCMRQFHPAAVQYAGKHDGQLFVRDAGAGISQSCGQSVRKHDVYWEFTEGDGGAVCFSADEANLSALFGGRIILVSAAVLGAAYLLMELEKYK